MTDQDVFSVSKRNSSKSIWIILQFVIAALVIVIPIRLFVAQPFVVTGTSMEPTLMPGEYLVIDKLSYRLHKPERGDVIILRFPLEPDMYYVKRVVGLPGEVVRLQNGLVTIVTPDGKAETLQEPYLEPDKPGGPTATIMLTADEFFVLGDNRAQSSDSRDWGPLQDKFIVGRAFARLSPISLIGLLPGQYRYPLSVTADIHTNDQE